MLIIVASFCQMKLNWILMHMVIDPQFRMMGDDQDDNSKMRNRDPLNYIKLDGDSV